MKKTLITLAALAALAVPASAADLGRGRSAPGGFVAAPLTAVPVWTGFYAGAHLGYSFGGRFDTNVPGFAINNPSGLFGGLQAGYDWQFDRFVIGAAGDISLAGVNRSTVFLGQTYRGREDWTGSIRARAGVAVQDNLLLYGTAGFAFGGVKVSETPLPVGTQSRTLTGYTLGVGGEYMFTRNLAGLVEYRYTDLSRGLYNGIAGGPRIGYEGHSVRTGVNYRF